MTRKQPTIAVVGAGISGLTFATALKERGLECVVFERAERVGGKSCTVLIDGRPHDLGATMGVPIDYRPVLRLSRRAGIREVPFPREQTWSLEAGRPVALNPLRELPGILAEGANHQWDGRVIAALLRCRDRIRAIPRAAPGESARLSFGTSLRDHESGRGSSRDSSSPAIAAPHPEPEDLSGTQRD